MKKYFLTQDQFSDLYLFDGAIIKNFSIKDNVFNLTASGNILLPRSLGIVRSDNENILITFDKIIYLKVEADSMEIVIGEKNMQKKSILYFGGAWEEYNNVDLSWEVICTEITLSIES